jgi:hypothetical protein
MFLLASCATDQSRTDNPADARIDHVIVGVSDLEQGVRELERLSGTRPAIGGVHPGRGTRNALLSLGDGVYLELIAPNRAEPIDSAEIRELKGFTRLKPLGWAVRVTDLAGMLATMRRHGIAPSPLEPGSRMRPDGTLLKWATFGLADLDHPLVPFFIRWEDMQLHPSRTSPGGCRLVSLRLFDPRPNELARVVRDLHLDVPIEQGPNSQMELKLFCATGEVVLQ